MPVTLAPRRTQAQRSAATRRRLLDATVACLVELGYGGTTTSAVAEHAGVSRGAQLHHYGTRQQLMGAAVEHLAAQRLEAVEAAASRLPEDDTRPRRALDLLAEALSGPLYAATLELYVAARVDRQLHEALVPVEQQLTKELRRLCREYVTADPVLVQLTLDLLLGRGVGSLLSPVRPGRQRQLLDAWAEVVAAGAGR
ncbi:MAG TPA: TetR/AcrR family transcriptional regulator [Mycobacteriales bacterium]|nr:TetR/AcrR family transcriptional regulator [Mycobacteriales bacterium]